MKSHSESPWLAPWEQEEVIGRLIEFNADLLRWDCKRNLQLKSGGKTDIYVNLRNARDCPQALNYLAKIYRNPLLRLNVDRFTEVPDSVSCFTGNLSALTNIPMITIRSEPKEGRVSKAKIIGKTFPNEKIGIIDDVITDGTSKYDSISECLRRGLNLTPIIVLVDRQQGWKEVFQDRGIALDVWPGMTLHDIRKYLINHEIMPRCNNELEERNPLVVALDNMNWEKILQIVDPLRTTGCILKVNDALFEKGMDLIENLKIYGRVVADLKSHDIPNTVANICAKLTKYQPWGITVHGSGGEDMIKAAVNAVVGTKIKIFAVTVLTSMKDDCEEVYTRRPLEQAIAIARIAKRAGAHGLVSSPEEIKELKKVAPKMEIFTPGIRSADVSKDDQQRTSTPEGALELGADYIVMGRELTNDPDPAKKALEILKRIGFL